MWGHVRSGFAVAVLASILAGCGPDEAPSAAGPFVECTGIPSDRCEEAIANVVRDARGVPIVSIEVRCATVCTPAEGQGSVSVVLADGRRMESGFGWSSAGPAPVPVEEPTLPVEPVCQGVPLQTCRDMAVSAMFEFGDAPAEVVAIVVRCTALPCLPASGEGTTEVRFADGTRSTTGWSYQSGGG